MPTYITLIKFTGQGVSAIKEGPNRLDAGKETLRAFGSELRAPHGGVWVTPLISNALGFLLAVALGMVVMAAIVVALKSMKPNPIVEAEQAADAEVEARTPQTV